MLYWESLNRLRLRLTAINQQSAKRKFAASLSRDGDWVVAQCLEVDVASQVKSESEALANFKEALTLHFEPPAATDAPSINAVEIVPVHSEISRGTLLSIIRQAGLTAEDFEEL